MARLWILILIVTSCDGLPVSSRFRLDNGTNLSFRVLMPNNAVFGTTQSNSNSAGRMAVSLFYRFKSALRNTKVNFTFVAVKDFTSGIPNKFGNYTGAIGKLQRNEGDVAFQWARLDSFIGEPVVPGPPFTTGDIMIATSQLPKENITRDILNTFSDFDALAYSAFGTCAFITASLLAFVVVVEKGQFKSIVRRFRRQLFRICWAIACLVFDQEDFRVQRLSAKILWTHFVFATFFAVFGVFLNSMATDMVAERPVRQIESLDDQLSEEFAGTAPTIVKNFFLYPLLLSSLNGTKMHRLLVLSQRRNASLLDVKFTMEGLSEIRNIIRGRIDDNRASLLLMKMFCRVVWRFLCLDSPEIMHRIREAREMFGGGIIVWMTRRGWNDGLRRFANYKLGTIFEMGLSPHIAQDMAKETFEETMNFKTTLETMKCMAGEVEEKDKATPIMTLSALRSIWCLSLTGIVVSVILLFIEIAFSKIRKQLRRIRRQLAAMLRHQKRLVFLRIRRRTNHLALRSVS